jgi:hypothetical protein
VAIVAMYVLVFLLFNIIFRFSLAAALVMALAARPKGASSSRSAAAFGPLPAWAQQIAASADRWT